jgi:hypothetical protein
MLPDPGWDFIVQIVREALSPPVENPIGDGYIPVVIDHKYGPVIAGPNIVCGNDIKMDVLQTNIVIHKLVGNVVTLALITNDEVNILVLVKSLYHLEPDAFQLQFVSFIHFILGPLKPGTFMGFPFRRHIKICGV